MKPVEDSQGHAHMQHDLPGKNTIELTEHGAMQGAAPFHRPHQPQTHVHQQQTCDGRTARLLLVDLSVNSLSSSRVN